MQEMLKLIYLCAVIHYSLVYILIHFVSGIQECENKGGDSKNDCAEGFGVCCLC